MKQKVTQLPNGMTLVTQEPSPFRARVQKLFEGWESMGKAGLSYDPVEDAAVLCEKIETEAQLEVLRELSRRTGHAVNLGVSLGVAWSTAHESLIAELEKADGGKVAT